MKTIFDKDSKLIDLIKVYKNAIPDSFCKDLINKSIENNHTWIKNSWIHYQWDESDDTYSRKAMLEKSSAIELEKLVSTYASEYINEFAQPFSFKIKQIKNMELHKCPAGTKILPHHDHGAFGLPICTIVGLLNDEFEGGEFMFWNEDVIKLEVRDILIFPSLFPYVHQVTPITSGTRYTFLASLF